MFPRCSDAESRALLNEHRKSWKSPAIYNLIAGDFSIERAFPHEGVTVHTRDTSIYARTLGKFATQKQCDLTLRPEIIEALPWLPQWMEKPEGRLAVMMLAKQFMPFVGKDTEYHRRMLGAYEHQFPNLFEKTVEKISAATLNVASFADTTVEEYISQRKPDHPVVCFLPPSPADLRKVESQLAQCFDEVASSEPYTLTQEELEAIVDRKHWFISSPEPIEWLEGNTAGVLRSSNFREPIIVYSSTPHLRTTKPTVKAEPVVAPRLGRGDRIGDALTLAPLTSSQFQMLRSQYLNPMIKTATATVMVAIMSEGRIIGVLGGSKGNYKPDQLYFMTDFAVSGSDYPKLSKLVVMAGCSKEFLHLAQRALNRRLRVCATTAFSNRPRSMKYRGILDLEKRAPTDMPHFKYMLNYGGELGRWTLEEAVAEWRNRGWDELREEND